MRRIIGLGTILFFVLVISGLGRLFYFYYSPLSAERVEKTVVIDRWPFSKTIQYLESEGLLTDPFMFKFSGRVFGFSGKIKRGEYLVHTQLSPQELVEILVAGKSIEHTVVIPEGLNLYQVAELLGEAGILAKDQFLALALSQTTAKDFGLTSPTMEGFVFPESYKFTKFTDGETILKTMHQRFRAVYDRAIAPLAKNSGFSKLQLVTLASIIEKETGNPEERPLISSVFHNRLKIGMPLQSDPTVIYGKSGDKKNITRTDLKTPSPYNTYTLKGLPIGPISNPGEKSLLAVVKPTQSEFLYFVSRNDGTHKFSKTFKEHNAAVQGFQKNPSARTGKSWRDLNQKKAAH